MFQMMASAEETSPNNRQITRAGILDMNLFESRFHRQTLRLIAAALITSATFLTNKPLSAQDDIQPMQYPKTKTVDQVDEYFGLKVADPYRWLEDDVRESDDVRNWVKDQNKITFSYIENLPFREEIESRLTELWNFEKYGIPSKQGGRYYFSKNDGLQNQSVVYQMDTLDSEPKIFMDPNQWSKDGTIALGGLAFSDDGKYVAYGVQDSGSDWRTWKLMDITTGKTLDDEIRWIKFGSVAWGADSKGFYYSRYDAPQEGDAFQGLNKNQKVYYHAVGTPQSKDVLIHADAKHPEWGFQVDVSEVHAGVWVVLREKFASSKLMGCHFVFSVRILAAQTFYALRAE